MANLEISGFNNIPVYEKAASEPSTPTEVAKVVHGCRLKRTKPGKEQRVSFPSDDTIVTSYFDAPVPWDCPLESFSTDELVRAYRKACDEQGVKPLCRLLEQLQKIKSLNRKDNNLNLKGEKLTSKHCETLEEVFKRVQFQTVDLEACGLDDEGSAAVFDMIEYYESASNLNISFNKHIGLRGWQSCSRMLKKTPCIQYIDARNTGLNDQSMLILGRALRLGSGLFILHLENSGLNGRSLVILMAALKLNNVLRELYLGDNKISSADGLQVGNLLRANSWLELLDLRNNNLQDLGMSHVLDGLSHQPILGGSGLQTLVLWNNHISSNGMKHLVHSLPHVGNLKTLNLGHNNIGNSGLQQLKQGLMCNKTVIHLGLQNTNITCEGAVAIAEYIAESKQIMRVDLRDNKIQVAGLMALSLSLKHNESVTRVDLDHRAKQNQYDDIHDHNKLLKDISQFCKRNKEQKELEAWNAIKPKPNLPESLLIKTSHLTSSLCPANVFDDNGDVQCPSMTSIQQCDNAKEVTKEANSVKETTGNELHLLREGFLQNCPIPVSGKSRFRVSQVFLEKEGEKAPLTKSGFSSPVVDSPLVVQTVITDPGISNMENLQSVDGLSPPLLSSFVEDSKDHHTSKQAASPAERNIAQSLTRLDQKSSEQLACFQSSGRVFISSSEEKEICETDVSKCFSVQSCQVSSSNLSHLPDSSSVQSASGNAQLSMTTKTIETTAPSATFYKAVVVDGAKMSSSGNTLAVLPNQVDFSDNKRNVKIFQEYSSSVLKGLNNERNNFIEVDVMGQKTKNQNFPDLANNQQYLRMINRRVSTPVVSLTPPSTPKPIALNLSVCKHLEGLDLRSSVPLSPTRLMEGIAFPDPPLTMK
ncbi:uncharacterized protein LOC143228866 isoform X2 [Tachypleus tridentatus]|uniref:uncharacterized protein LOC143228866 isoform X2 n=1 Tax=Tachypleus tridentatus TaxID=6853 RepID=UPI003FD5B0B9